MARCLKTGMYPTTSEAYKAAAGQLRRAGRGEKNVPLRAYWCRQHKAFHLTSAIKVRRKPKRRRR